MSKVAFAPHGTRWCSSLTRRYEVYEKSVSNWRCSDASRASTSLLELLASTAPIRTSTAFTAGLLVALVAASSAASPAPCSPRMASSAPIVTRPVGLTAHPQSPEHHRSPTTRWYVFGDHSAPRPSRHRCPPTRWKQHYRPQRSAAHPAVWSVGRAGRSAAPRPQSPPPLPTPAGGRA